MLENAELPNSLGFNEALPGGRLLAESYGLPNMEPATGRIPGSEPESIQFSNIFKEVAGFSEANLVATSEQLLGRQLWSETQFADVTENGNKGCAASVSRALQEAGEPYANSASVLGLVGQLKGNGWSEAGGLADARPGDVLYGDGGGTHQHIGIVGQDPDGQLVLYNNSSSDGKWHKQPLNSNSIANGYSSGQIYTLRKTA